MEKPDLSESARRHVSMLTCVVEKYDLVGRLLKPGDEPTDYTDTEEEHGASDSLKEDW